jgi:hypothetical protein
MSNVIPARSTVRWRGRLRSFGFWQSSDCEGGEEAVGEVRKQAKRAVS